MEKAKLIVIEGPQGTGKSTLANYLRENIPGSNLYRLSGQKDKSITGKNLSSQMYDALLTYLEQMQNIPMDLIFDRTFFTEEVYANLGYKEYSFYDIYEELLKRFVKLNYDIYYFNLYLQNEALYEERLKRDHHNYQSFSLKNSTDQQFAYYVIGMALEEQYGQFINIYNIAMDDFSLAYEKINQILKLKR